MAMAACQPHVCEVYGSVLSLVHGERGFHDMSICVGVDPLSKGLDGPAGRFKEDSVPLLAARIYE